MQLTNSLAIRLSSGNTATVPGTINNSTSLGRNGTSADPVIIYDVPIDAPVQVIYQDVTDPSIAGVIDIIDKQGPTGATGATGPAGTPTEASYAPVFDGTGFSATGTVASGSFIRSGKDVTFDIAIDFATATLFGTGQYSVTLPVLPNASISPSFIGTLDINGDGATVYTVIARSTTSGSAFLSLWYLGTDGQLTALNGDGSSPTTLTTDSLISINGSFKAESE